MVWLIEKALEWNVKIITVQDLLGCSFPAVEEQPASIRPVFLEKALLYVPGKEGEMKLMELEYNESVIQSVLNVLKSITERVVIQNEGGDFDVFLSHRRITGQGNIS